jgi:hypothetical protein
MELVSQLLLVNGRGFTDVGCLIVVSCALGPHVSLPFQKLILTVSFSCLACISCSQQSHILSCFRLWVKVALSSKFLFS